MKSHRAIVPWVLAATAGALLIVWAYPLAFPLYPASWETSRAEAIAIAEERFSRLGEEVDHPFRAVAMGTNYLRERRLFLKLQSSGEASDDKLLGDALVAESLVGWLVRVYGRQANAGADWTYEAKISPSGRVTSLLHRERAGQETGSVAASEARRLADAHLAEQGFDLARFEEPEVRAQELDERTDTRLLYRDRERRLGDELAYGVEVVFRGDHLAGYSAYLEDPEDEDLAADLQGLLLIQQIWLFLPVILCPLVAIPFLRRYHEGEVGVRRGLQILTVSAVCGLLSLLLMGRALALGFGFDILPPWQMKWLAIIQMSMFYILPSAVIALLAWAVGEALCRERAPRRLAGFDALFQGSLGNATVARGSLIGLAAGTLLAGLVLAAAALLGEIGVMASLQLNLGPWWNGARWAGLAVLLFTVPVVLYQELFGRLLLGSAAVHRFGPWLGGGLITLFAGLVFFPPLLVVPLRWSLVLCVGYSAALLFIFLRHGLLSSTLAGLSAALLLEMMPFLRADDPWMQFQGALPLFAVALPFLISARHLLSGKQFFYRYDDVPPHVRRITERERQRVELETARGIQSSILPDLPPQIAGVQVAHAYRPASEVGGDFYDVLALEDGRLALAIGDVAGHGVSSGLVMSMAKAALAVQVTVDPTVHTVFSTLNRVIYQSARKRLLATLCYAILDPRGRELRYASAGHLYPYVITQDRHVHPLEYTAYPLGVRGSMEVEARSARLGEGDTLVLFSDGLVEARPEGSDDLFGFDRLEACLAENAHLSVQRLLGAVEEAVEDHTDGAPQEDDQTLLVLRLP